MILPQFSTVVEEDTREQEIAVECGIGRADRGCAPHHLGGVLDQTAAARVMISPRGGGPSKPIAEVGEKQLGQSAQTRVGKRGDRRLDKREVRGLGGAERRRAIHEERTLIFVKVTCRPPLRIQPVIVALTEFTGDSEEGTGTEGLAKAESRGIRPGAQRQPVFRVGEDEFVEGFSIARFFSDTGIDLSMHL